LCRVITRKSAEKILAHLNSPGTDGSAVGGDVSEDEATDNKVPTTTS
jgi:hypothetical protein